MNVTPLTHQTICSRSLLLLQAKESGYFEKPASKVRIKQASLRWDSQVRGNDHKDHHNLNYFK
jgi:ribosomal protein S21